MERAFRPERLGVAEPAPRALAWWVWGLAALLVFILAAGGHRLKDPSMQLSTWWPAAGVSVWLLLAAGRERRRLVFAVVFVVVAAATMVAGRDPLTSVLAAAANVVEVATVSLLLQRTRSHFRITSARDALQFIGAVALAGAVAGLCVAAVMPASPTGQGLFTFGYLDSAFRAAASHISATLLIASFAILPPRFSDAPSRPEMVAQSALLAVIVGFVFAPGMDLPLSFLPFAFVVWAAFRFPVRLALAQALLTSLVVLALTLWGGGPFAAAVLTTPRLVLIVELYMIVLAVITLLLIAARYEARQATRTAVSVSQLITGGFVASRVGLIIAEEHDRAISVLWANRAAVTAIDAELGADGTWAGPLADNALASIADAVETVHEDPATGSTISLVANRIPGDTTRFSAQLVDVGATIRMAQARHDAERERAAARSALADLEQQRDDFVATTSHELRTPVTSITGYAELLAESPTLSAAEQSWVQIIVRNTARLTTLVEDLLTLGRSGIPAGKHAVLSLSELAAEVIDMHRPMADARRIRLEIDVDEDATAHCAPDDAGRALGNLVSNAIKFTPMGGTVRISSGPYEGRVALTVIDTGPGMPPETLAQAFDRFYRGNDAIQANTPGTGLGLAIAVQLAERNGGLVRLASLEGGGLAATLVFADPFDRETVGAPAE